MLHLELQAPRFIAQLCCCLLPAAALALQPSPDRGVEELVKRMEAAYERIHDLSAQFTQVSTSTSMGRRKAERGTLLLERPGKMRLEYNPPEPKLFVARGETTYFYVPQDNQVIEAPRSDLREQGVPSLMLDGEPTFLSEYDVSPVASDESEALAPAPSEVVVSFRPRAKAGFDHALIAVDVKDAIARRILIVDRQGNRTEYSFEDLRVNQGVDEAMFAWSPPPGVELVKP